jgi:hypothetical protein
VYTALVWKKLRPFTCPFHRNIKSNLETPKKYKIPEDLRILILPSDVKNSTFTVSSPKKEHQICFEFPAQALCLPVVNA